MLLLLLLWLLVEDLLSSDLDQIFIPTQSHALLSHL